MHCSDTFQDQEPVKNVIQPTTLPTIQDGHQKK